jgi:hypothetical protein
MVRVHAAVPQKSLKRFQNLGSISSRRLNAVRRGSKEVPTFARLPTPTPLVRRNARRPIRRYRCQDPRHQVSALGRSVAARRPTKVAAIALANKLARMAWAMMAKGERYNYPASLRV